jgi:hypothetical protein
VYTPGYYLSTGVEGDLVTHASYSESDGMDTCKHCPAGETSAGGITTSCHVPSETWTNCTHMACKAETGEHCTFHRSDNPFQESDLTAVNKSGCTGRQIGKDRITVFHHGMENAGIMHHCKLTGTRADADRGCECLCKDHLVPTPAPTAYPTAAPTAAPTESACVPAPWAAVTPPAVETPASCLDVIAMTDPASVSGTCTAGTGGCIFSDDLSTHPNRYDHTDVCAGKEAAPDYVVKYTNPTASPITFKWNSCDVTTQFDMAFAIWTVDKAAGTCSQLACNDDAVDPAVGACNVGAGGASFLQHVIPANSDLYLVLSAFSVDPGTFKIHITEDC